MHPTTVQKDLLKFKLRGEVKGSQIIINKNDFEHIVTMYLRKESPITWGFSRGMNFRFRGSEKVFLKISK